MDQIPFSRDSDCLSLAVRIVREGLPDFSPAQIKRIGNHKEFFELEKCSKRKGADFACVCDKLIPQEFSNLNGCLKTFRKNEKCENEIFAACEKLQTKWSALLLSGSLVT